MDKLKKRIEEKFGSQTAFADHIGVDKTTMSRLLSGETSWKVERMWQTAEALEIPDSQIREYFFPNTVVNKTTGGKR